MFACFAGGSIIIFKIFSTDTLVGDSDVTRATILLFFFFGTSTAGLTYCMTYLFKSASTAQNVVIFLQVVCMFLVIAFFILQFVPSACHITNGIEYVLLLLPGFSVGNGFVKVLRVKFVSKTSVEMFHGFRTEM